GIRGWSVTGVQTCALPIFDVTRFDAVAAHAYKWLMSPRGTSFMYVDPGLAERLTPDGAGWFATEDVFGTYYGGPLRLAESARRLDRKGGVEGKRGEVGRTA